MSLCSVESERAVLGGGNHISVGFHLTMAILLTLYVTAPSFWAVAQVQPPVDSSPRLFVPLEGGGIGLTVVANLHETLDELWLLPDHERPTVMVLASIDSHSYELERLYLRSRWEFIVGAAKELGAPEPILALAPSSSTAGRASRGSFFPSNAQQLEDTGYGWLVDLERYELRWEAEGRIADEHAGRYTLFGVEHIYDVHLILCIDRNAILGWARSWYQQLPGAASLGRFVEDCTSGETALGVDPALSPELMERHGLVGGPFALLLPHFAYEHALAAVDLAARNLAPVTPNITLRIVAIDTTDAEGTAFVSAQEHARLLEAMGVEIDDELSRELPAWVNNYGSFGTSLLLFDEQGRLHLSYFALNVQPLGMSSLTQDLLRLGLY